MYHTSEGNMTASEEIQALAEEVCEMQMNRQTGLEFIEKQQTLRGLLGITDAVAEDGKLVERCRVESWLRTEEGGLFFS